MTPTPDGIRVSVEALRADARAWLAAADDLDHAAARSRRTELPSSAFSFAGGATATSYAQLRAKISALLVDGSGNFTDIAGALRSSAHNYEADEAANEHALRGIY